MTGVLLLGEAGISRSHKYSNGNVAPTRVHCRTCPAQFVRPINTLLSVVSLFFIFYSMGDFLVTSRDNSVVLVRHLFAWLDPCRCVSDGLMVFPRYEND